jgi:hypothetical protein
MFVSHLIERISFLKSHQYEFSQMTIKTNRPTVLHDFKRIKQKCFLVIKRLKNWWLALIDRQAHIFFSMNRSAIENDAFLTSISVCLSVCCHQLHFLWWSMKNIEYLLCISRQKDDSRVFTVLFSFTIKTNMFNVHLSFLLHRLSFFFHMSIDYFTSSWDQTM